MADQLKQGTAPTESDDTSERYSGDFHTTEQATAPVTYPGQPPATHPGVPGYQPRDPYAMVSFRVKLSTIMLIICTFFLDLAELLKTFKFTTSISFLFIFILLVL